ncbi:MAG: TVP38/TMEM64 family protein [Pseudonocardia sp.]
MSGDPPPGRSPTAAEADRSSAGWAAWLRPLAPAVPLLAVAAVVMVVGVPDVERIRAEIAATGRLAPVLFPLLYAATTLAGVPRNVLSALAGLLFGLASGAVLVFVGSLLGAAAGFALGRALGREAVERLAGPRLARVDARLRRRGMLAVLGLRALPVVPFTAVSYGAGLSAIRVRDYAVGTALGVIPGTLFFVSLGAHIPVG